MSYSTDIFKNCNLDYDWKTLYVGLKSEWISNDEITRSAIEFLSSHPDSDHDIIMQLAWGENDSDYEELLSNIVQASVVEDVSPGSEAWQFEKRKWRFGILTYLRSTYQHDIQGLLNKVAEVYAEMDYPEDMEDFINYLTPKDGYDPTQHSQEENVARLVHLFYKFLDKEKQFFGNIE